MDEETLKLLVDLHVNNHRQGPGSEQAFGTAFALANINTAAPLTILDVGSGTGSATIPLLENTAAQVTAVELQPAFLEKLIDNATRAGVSDRLTTIAADMTNLPFDQGHFDVIWSEGAVYNMGFDNGIQSWRQFLKPTGTLVVSEITWLRSDVPAELKSYWESEYPEIDFASNKIAILEANGYSPIGYFTLTPDCWLDEYYKPIQASLPAFLERHAMSEKVQEIVAAEQTEFELYKQYQDYYSYGVYIAKLIDA